MGRLDGRAAVITGAGVGIGEGIASRFAAEVARVLVSDINESATHRVAESPCKRSSVLTPIHSPRTSGTRPKSWP